MFALTTAFAMPVQAAGLSDKQKDEIAEFVKCKTFLLKGDLVSFEADPDCGGDSRVEVETGSLLSSKAQTRRPNARRARSRHARASLVSSKTVAATACHDDDDEGYFPTE